MMFLQNSLRFVSHLTLALLSGVSLSILGNCGVSLAQTGTVQPLQDLRPQDNRDPFSGSSGSATSGMMELIHRANMGQLRDMKEFTQQQRENLDDAAAQFRARQLQLMRQSAPASVAPGVPTVPVVAPPSAP